MESGLSYLVLAHRLVRRICKKCSVELTVVPTRTLIEIAFPPDQVGLFKLYKGRGCGAGNGTGCKRQVGLYEVMEVSNAIRDLVTGGRDRCGNQEAGARAGDADTAHERPR